MMKKLISKEIICNYYFILRFNNQSKSKVKFSILMEIFEF